MKKWILLVLLAFTTSCSNDLVTLEDNKGLIDANRALIELNSVLDALLADRVTALEARMDAAEAAIAAAEADIAALEAATGDNADAIAALRRKVRQNKREQDRVNRLNALKFKYFYFSIGKINKKLEKLVREDRNLSKRIDKLSSQLSGLGKLLALNSVLDLFRYAKIQRDFADLAQQISELGEPSVSVTEVCGQLLLSTPDGFVGPVLHGEEIEVLYEAGDWVEEHEECVKRHPIFGWCQKYETVPGHHSEGSTVSVFSAENVTLEYLSEEDLACEEN